MRLLALSVYALSWQRPTFTVAGLSIEVENPIPLTAVLDAPARPARPTTPAFRATF